MNYLRIILISFSICFLVGCFFAGIGVFILRNHAIDFSSLDHANEERGTIILDVHGAEWFRLTKDKRVPVSYEMVPSLVINAFIATEDWQFFSHYGISFKGIMRSLLVNLYHGRKAQGASTITQQLVKLLFFDASKTFSRKIKEQVYAVLAEMQYTKEQIMQTYLNNIYFGCGIYGVQAAAQRFWGKNIQDISLDEAATLAGIVRRPSLYCPLLYPLSARQRRDVVLQLMKQRACISDEEYREAVQKEVVVIHAKKEDASLFHAREMVRSFLESHFDKHLIYRQGLVVQTTFDLQAQKEATHSFKEQCYNLRQSLKVSVDGGFISFDRSTGAVRALVGGCDDAHISPFNRVTQAYRQLGSIFKPLIYAAALNKGKTFADTALDEPYELIVNQQRWCPRNYNKKFNGEVTLAYALSHSSNIVTIKTLLDIGFDEVITLARRAHLSCPIYKYPSLALGCVDTTLFEGAAMFNIFANGGIYVEPYYISWVKDRWDKKIWRHTVKQEIVLSRQVADQVAHILMLGIERIHKIFPQQWIKSQAISKTGTTNDSRTCWFIGSTPELTTAVYIGSDDNRPLGTDVFPIKTAFPIWLSFNRAVERNDTKFNFDASLERICINEKTGKAARAGSPGSITIAIADDSA